MSKPGITTIILTLAVISAVPAKRAAAPAPAAFGPAPGEDCITPVSNASDCWLLLSERTPGDLESNVVCLCELLSGEIAKQFGLSIDLGRAVNLPAVCKIANVPPATLCSAVGYPVAAPASGPSSEGPSTGLITPAAASPGGLAASPSAGEKVAASIMAGSAFAVSFSILSTLF
uniref:Bifunctional inhibitor/plant lipid transfer protein/seed storage helical domain-containing protein n=1 Tax=Salix viminalis TaxID=40686 RepID=A0A6N2LL48_SALVM